MMTIRDLLFFLAGGGSWYLIYLFSIIYVRWYNKRLARHFKREFGSMYEAKWPTHVISNEGKKANINPTPLYPKLKGFTIVDGVTFNRVLTDEEILIEIDKLASKHDIKK